VIQSTLTIPEDIKNYLHYNENTGDLTWMKSPSRRMVVGSMAGCLDSEGYKLVRFNSKNYRYARVCFFLHHGVQPSGVVDHINRDRGDNRIENLRLVTMSQNRTNARGFGKSDYRGVGYRPERGTWTSICGGTYLGSSNKAEEAALMYNYKALEMYGKHSYVNQVFEDVSDEILMGEYSD